MQRIPVYFLYARGHRARGSVAMRALQLARFANTLLSEDYAPVTVPMPRKGRGEQVEAVRHMRDAVIVLTKASIQHLDPEAFAHLKAHNLAIFADWIDKAPRSPYLDEIDVHIASSVAQERFLRDRFPERPVRYVTHHSDPRISGIEPGSVTAARAVYVGRPDNVTAPPEIVSEITWLDAQTSAEFEAILHRLPDFNLHLAVRAETDEAPGIFKPFTKGFTAAACRSNILVQRQAHDALAYLGEDYPYLLTDREPETVVEGFRHARDSFGGPDWQRGLEIMEDVRQRSSPGYVTGQFGAILGEVTGRPTRLSPLPEAPPADWPDAPDTAMQDI